MGGGITEDAAYAFAHANQQRQMFGHDRLRAEHLLLGIILAGEPGVSDVLSARGITVLAVRSMVEPGAAPEQVGASACPLPGATAIIGLVAERSAETARSLGHDRVGSGHILLALISSDDGGLNEIFTALGVSSTELHSAVVHQLRTRR